MNNIKKENPIVFIKSKDIKKTYTNLRELEADIHFSKLIEEYEKIETMKE